MRVFPDKGVPGKQPSGLVGQEFLDGDGGKNADAGQHDHQFDQREALILWATQ